MTAPVRNRARVLSPEAAAREAKRRETVALRRGAVGVSPATERDIRKRGAVALTRAVGLLSRAADRVEGGELDAKTVRRLARRASGGLRAVLAKVDRDPQFEPTCSAGEDDVAAALRTLRVVFDRRREFHCRHVLVLADAAEALVDGLREHAARVDGRRWL